VKASELKKNKDYYRKLNYPIRVIEDETGGWVADIPDLPGCIAVVEKFEQISEAIGLVKEGWIELMLEKGQEIPRPTLPVPYSGKFSLRIPRSLHARLAALSEEEGTSLNNYCTYLLSLSSGRQEARARRRRAGTGKQAGASKPTRRAGKVGPKHAKGKKALKKAA
jgi:antitoxin HicB